MPKFELKKTIDATKLNPRTKIPVTGPPVTISFGAIIEDVEQDRDYAKFTNLGQPYRCSWDIFSAALDWKPLAETVAVGPAPAKAAEENQPAAPQVTWETLRSSGVHSVSRTKVPGGWLVLVDGSATFLPDPKHKWDGATES